MTGVPIEALSRLLGALDKLEIHYMMGGSGASSVHGLPRSTQDIDFVIRMSADHVDRLGEELRSDFYIDLDQVRSALSRQRSFNVIHFKTAYKFDLFPLGAERYEQVQFGRRRFKKTDVFGPEPIEFAVASPEDVILSKLRWYRMGGGVSEKQWNDVLGVIAVQRANLDMAYLLEWAEHLKLADLLEQALAEKQEPLP